MARDPVGSLVKALDEYVEARVEHTLFQARKQEQMHTGNYSKFTSPPLTNIDQTKQKLKEALVDYGHACAQVAINNIRKG